MGKKPGWYGESWRHALASHGIKTTFSEDEFPIELLSDGVKFDIDGVEHIEGDNIDLQKLFFVTAGLCNVEGKQLKLSEDKSAILRALNEKAEHKYEWIADLDMVRHDGEWKIIVNDVNISDQIDLSEMTWRDDEDMVKDWEGSHKTDPEECVGYIHYHSSCVKPKYTAQDVILGLTIDGMREQDNKDRFRPTIVGLVTDDWVQFLYLTPTSKERKKYKEKLEKVQNDKMSTDEYFKQVSKIKEEMKNDKILYETDKVNY